MRALSRFYARQQFDPGLPGIWLNPFYFARKGLVRHLRRLSPHIRGRTLDVGCGQKPYAAIFPCSDYVGMELDTEDNRRNKKADVFYDGTTFPFPDSAFDSVVSSQVLEHVRQPVPFLREIRRVLKPGGAFLLTVPFVWDEHEVPFDYTRYTSFGIRHLLTTNGFDVVEQRKSVNDIRAVFQMKNCFLYSLTVCRRPLVNLLSCALLMAPVTIAGILASLVLPRVDGLYLDNVILARRPGAPSPDRAAPPSA